MLVMKVFIKQEGEKYIASSRNLVGISFTAKTYEKAESAMDEAIKNRIDELNRKHNTRMIVSDLPIEECIPCIYKYGTSEEQCGAQAQKDGLCRIHWKKLYSHAFGTTINLKACPLCNEPDLVTLKRWDAPCSFKAENPNWEQIFEEMKIKNHSKWKKEFRQIKLENLGNKLQCKEILKNGERCPNEVTIFNLGASMKRLCWRHQMRHSRKRS